MGYSGDTAPCEGLDRIAANVRLLLCEASFRDTDENPPGIHLTGVDAGSVAARSQASRLVLTHVPPWFDAEELRAEAKAAFDGDVTVVAADAAYEI